MLQLTPQQSVDLVQFSKDFFVDIASLNATYLGISVGIILGSGILLTVGMYFLNFKPMKQSLNKQKEEIEVIKKETETKVEDLKNSQNEVSNSIKNLKDENESILVNLKSVSDEEISSIKNLFDERQREFDDRMKLEIELRLKELNIKISSIEELAIKKMTALEEKNKQLDLVTSWNMHYVWENQNVPVNELSSIVETLEKAINYSSNSTENQIYIKLCFDDLPKIINKVKDDNPLIFKSLPSTVNKLESCLSLTELYPVQKKEILNNLEDLKKILIRS